MEKLPTGLSNAGYSLFAIITAWQGELEFWLRITATCVGIYAAVVSIKESRKSKKQRETL